MMKCQYKGLNYQDGLLVILVVLRVSVLALKEQHEDTKSTKNGSRYYKQGKPEQGKRKTDVFCP